MDRPASLFIASSLAFLLAGLSLGPYMLWLLAEGESTYRVVWPHVHLLLTGFVLGMIYGIGYHVLPRFAGKVLAHVRLAEVHWLLHTVGTVGLAVMVYLARGTGADLRYYKDAIGFGLMVVAGALLFALNLLATFGLLPTSKQVKS